MKKLPMLIFFLLIVTFSHSQAGGIVNKGAVIKFSDSVIISIDGDSEGDFVNKDDSSSLGSIAGDGTLYLEGDWTNSSSSSNIFDDSSSITVNFIGSDQSLSGSTSFVNLTKSVSSSATLTFPSGSANVTTVTGTLDLEGADGQLLELRSDSEGTQWQIDPQGTWSFSYLDVMDSDNISSNDLDVTDDNCTDSGNNTNWTFPFTLTVNNGSGSGSYAPETTVSIVADTSSSGQVFSAWTGDTDYVDNVNSSSTTVTMPEKDITVTATYVDDSETTYTLTVNNGSGSGDYTAGTSVAIVADSAADGQVFDQWTGDTDYIASIYTYSTYVTMPEGDISVTATYVDDSETTYTLTVSNGSGGGSYTAGTNVTVTADDADIGMVFDQWTGNIQYLNNPRSTVATATMPDQDISFTATYKTADKKKYSLKVKNGTGSGRYIPGQEVTVSATIPDGQAFSAWTGATHFLNSAYAYETTLTMPDRKITLTATFIDADETGYTLTVNHGSGSGSYTVGTKVTITADAPPAGREFSHWVGDSFFAADPSSASTILSMPPRNISLAAVYSDVTPQLKVTALNRYGQVHPSGTVTLNYGETVNLRAIAKAGCPFKCWTVNGNAVINDKTAADTEITVYGKTLVIAVFCASQTNRPSLNIATTNRANSDSVKLRNFPITFRRREFNPSRSMIVSIDGNKFIIKKFEFKNNQSGEKYTGRITDKNQPKINLQLDFNALTWDFTANSASLTELNGDDGLVCALWPDTNITSGCNVSPDTKISWQFNGQKNDSETLPVTGNTMAEFSVNKARGNLNNAGVEKNQLDIIDGVFNLGDGIDFDNANDEVIVKVDDYSLVITPGSFVFNKNAYIYQDKANGIKMTLDQNKNIWKLTVNKFDNNKIDPTDGLDVFLTVGDYQGGKKLSAQYKSNYKYNETKATKP